MEPIGSSPLTAIGRHQEAQVFIGVAEGPLAGGDGGVIGAVHARRLGQLVERDLILLQPFARRAAGWRAVL